MNDSDPLQALLLRLFMSVPPDILIMDLVLFWELGCCFWLYVRHFRRSWLAFLWEIHIFWGLVLAAKGMDMTGFPVTMIQFLFAAAIVFSTWCFRWIDTMVAS